MTVAARNEVTRNVGALSIRADIVPSSIDEEARTFDVVWTTGAAVLRSNWFGESFYEELSLDPGHVRMERFESGNTPFLDAHNAYDTDAVLGRVLSARLEPGRGTAKIYVVTGDEKADRIWNKIRQHALPNISVGYQPLRMEQVEGGDAVIPRYLVTEWEPLELSTVPIGADPGASIRSAARTVPCVFVTRAPVAQPRSNMDPKNRKRGEGESTSTEGAEGQRAAGDCGDCAEMDPEDPNYTDCCGEQAAKEGEKRGTKPAKRAAGTADNQAELKAAAERAVKAERERVAAIQRSGRLMKCPGERVQKYVDEGTPFEQARREMEDEMEKRDRTENPGRPLPPSPVSMTEDERDKYIRGAVSGIAFRCGPVAMARVQAGAKKKQQPFDADPGEFRGLSVIDLARECLERMGQRVRGLGASELIGLALSYRGGANSTSDFPIILENVLYKTLLGGYETAPLDWPKFCKKGTVTNFLPHPRLRLGMLQNLDPIGQAGEIKNQSVPDAYKESITAATYANIIALTRQTLVNDDLGAFLDLAAQLGIAAANTIEAAVYALLAQNAGLGPTMRDTNTLFHATHGNIGTGAAISVASLDADRVLMARQKDPASARTLNLRPAVLVVPVEIGGAAKVINASEWDVDAVAANSTNKNMVPNKVRGLFAMGIVDTAYLAANSTRRYLFADPASYPVLEVVFVDGDQAPKIENQQGWRSDGTEWRVILDAGVGAIDFRGAVTNAGA